MTKRIISKVGGGTAGGPTKFTTLDSQGVLTQGASPAGVINMAAALAGQTSMSSRPDPALSLTTPSFRIGQYDQPQFNVLPVRVAAPALLASPLSLAFLRTCREAAELLRPLMRLGLPESSIHNKCPHWRPDAPAPITCTSPDVRRVQRAAADGSLFSHVHHKVPAQHFYLQPINASHVVALNIFCLWSLSSYANRQQ